MKLTKEQLKRQHQDDKKRFHQIKGIMVIAGKHYRINRHGTCYLAAKTYNWRVGNQIHNLKNAKIGNIATVQDKGGKAPVLITKIIYAKGSIAQKMARKLKYVINFRYQKLNSSKIIEEKRNSK